ncbi:MAG: hypothetical protein RSC76_07625, partial [Oscillospiraceae bacterium]
MLGTLRTASLCGALSGELSGVVFGVPTVGGSDGTGEGVALADAVALGADNPARSSVRIYPETPSPVSVRTQSVPT